MKYPEYWRRRACSETSACLSPSYSEDTTSFSTSLELPDFWFHFDDDEYAYEDCFKNKKSVTFAEKDAVFVFRPGSSILGRRLKNQKKAKKKRDRRLRDISFSDTDENGDSMNSECYDSSTSLDTSSELSSSGAESSGDESSTAEPKTNYTVSQESKEDTKTKRKSHRKKNRKSKQSVKTVLETGSDF